MFFSYAATYVEKLAVEDSYKNGEVGRHSTIISEKINIQEYSLPELLEKIKNDYYIPDILNNINLIQSEEKRITGFSVSQMEDNDGMVPDLNQTNKWRKGELKLYYCTYTFLIEFREVRAIPIEDFENHNINFELMGE